jgi:hypothetical protein
MHLMAQNAKLFSNEEINTDDAATWEAPSCSNYEFVC